MKRIYFSALSRHRYNPRDVTPCQASRRLAQAVILLALRDLHHPDEHYQRRARQFLMSMDVEPWAQLGDISLSRLRSSTMQLSRAHLQSQQESLTA